jgi:hypothetical protein
MMYACAIALLKQNKQGRRKRVRPPVKKKKKFRSPQQGAEWLKVFTQNQKDWLSGAEGLGVGLKRVNLCSRQIMILPRKTKTCNVVGPPSGPPGPGRLYRLPPPPSRWNWQAGMQFRSMKQHLGGHLFHSTRKWKFLFVNVCECKSPIFFYRDVIFKLVANWVKCIKVLRDYVEK